MRGPRFICRSRVPSSSPVHAPIPDTLRQRRFHNFPRRDWTSWHGLFVRIHEVGERPSNLVRGERQLGCRVFDEPSDRPSGRATNCVDVDEIAFCSAIVDSPRLHRRQESDVSDRNGCAADRDRKRGCCHLIVADKTGLQLAVIGTERMSAVLPGFRAFRGAPSAGPRAWRRRIVVN